MTAANDSTVTRRLAAILDARNLIALKRVAGRAINLAEIEALGRLKQLGLDR